MAEPMPLVDVPDDAKLCEQLTARIEEATAKGMSAWETAHSVMPIVLATLVAERDAHEAIVRAKVAVEIEAAGKKIDREPHCIMPGLWKQWKRAAKIARGDA